MNPALSVLGYAEIVCAQCAMSFGVPARFESDRRSDHAIFYCPAGHSLTFNGPSKEEILQRKLAEREALIERRNKELEVERRKTEQARNSARSYKGKATELKNRVRNGVCPCCRRHFTNLHRHMQGQHPNFGKGEL